MENNTNTDNKPNMAAEMFKAYLDAKKLPYSSDESDVIWIKTDIKCDNTSSPIDIRVYFKKDEKHVSIVAGNFIVITNKEKYGDIFKLLNKLNKDWLWVKFYINEEFGQIYAVQDAIIQYDSCGEEVFELIIHMLSITEKAYPEIMKVVWS